MLDLSRGDLHKIQADVGMQSVSLASTNQAMTSAWSYCPTLLHAAHYPQRSLESNVPIQTSSCV